MEREEKLFEIALDSLISRNDDLRKSLTNFIFRLENQQLNWPSVLDTFGLLSGQINNFMKVLKNEKTPPLRNRVLLPLLLSPDRDEDLARITEGRVQTFNHDMVPHYLRTKLEPEVERGEQQLLAKSSQIAPEAGQKQLALVNKISAQIVDFVNNTREGWESESVQRANAAQTFSVTDTHTIIAAISSGVGLKPATIGPKIPQGQPLPAQPVGPRPSSVGKAPSTIKTNIKSASSATPYSR